jgi:nitrite reductase (cytochrome c-552)
MNGERKSMLFYTALAAGVAIATVAVMLLFQNITERKVESRFTSVPVVTITEETVDPAEWGKNFPSEFDSYKKTVDIQRTRHGGSEAFQKLDDDPRWREIFSGYPFGIDYREERGHAYMLQDQRDTERVKQFKQPGACLHCHASVTNAYVKVGLENGAPAGAANREAQLMKGFELVNKMPYSEATQLVKHPVACIDCHEPASMKLRVTRPGFLNGIRALAASEAPVPHFPSIESWRKEGRKGAYDPNALAGRQEMRSFVCGQCHVEYYFKPPDKYLTYPWHNGLKMEEAEAYYDEVGWKDWVHKEDGAPVLKAQHPEFEMWSQGIHARSGVTCVDCHMPYVREGARKVTDHQVRSPLLNEAKACQVCHRRTEQEIKDRVLEIQDRTKALMIRAEEATVAAIQSIASAQAAGGSEQTLAAARALHRKAQWRLDYVAAENSMGFHAPQEAARILGEAIDYARQAELAAFRLGGGGVAKLPVQRTAIVP